MNAEKKKTLKNVSITFITIFLSNAFVITSSFFLFFHYLHLDTTGIPLAAVVTFGNVILLTALFMAVHLIRNRITVDRPVRRIREGLEKITNSDLTVRIEPTGTSAAFDSIIESVNRMTEELSTVETLKTDFLSNVTHELKTPLAGVKSYAQLLRAETVGDEDRKTYAEAQIAAVNRMNDLITDILRLNKLENQKLTPKSEPFDLSEALTECLLQFEPVWEEKGIEPDAAIPDNVTVNADKELLDLVWNNLLSNAFKFTPAGGTVSVTLQKADDDLLVRVADTGPGMTAETLRHIFDKFYQGDTSHAAKGNGLGLALVRRVLDLTGNEIRVSSAPGQGSVFTVILKQANNT